MNDDDDPPFVPTRRERRGSAPGEHRGGRKKGTRNKVTLDRRRDTIRQSVEIAKTGKMPKEVMIEAMRYWFGLAGKYSASGPVPDADKCDRYLTLAAGIAKDAGPYFHPRLASVEIGGIGGGPIKTEDVSARELFASRILSLASRVGTTDTPETTH